MSDITTKRCSGCGAEKPTTEFGKDRSRKDGLEPRCKSCRAEIGRAAYVPRPKRTHKARIDRTGQRFASMTILEQRTGGRALCKCDCGNEKVTHVRNLAVGMTVNCADRSMHVDPRFQGADIGYDGAHNRVKGLHGSAGDYSCAMCGGQAQGWAYRHSDPDQRIGTSGKGKGSTYSSNPDHYFAACRLCHARWDAARRGLPREGLSLAHVALWLALDANHELENGAVA